MWCKRIANTMKWPPHPSSPLLGRSSCQILKSANWPQPVLEVNKQRREVQHRATAPSWPAKDPSWSSLTPAVDKRHNITPPHPSDVLTGFSSHTTKNKLQWLGKKWQGEHSSQDLLQYIALIHISWTFAYQFSLCSFIQYKDLYVFRKKEEIVPNLII